MHAVVDVLFWNLEDLARASNSVHECSYRQRLLIRGYFLPKVLYAVREQFGADAWLLFPTKCVDRFATRGTGRRSLANFDQQLQLGERAVQIVFRNFSLLAPGRYVRMKEHLKVLLQGHGR